MATNFKTFRFCQINVPAPIYLEIGLDVQSNAWSIVVPPPQSKPLPPPKYSARVSGKDYELFAEPSPGAIEIVVTLVGWDPNLKFPVNGSQGFARIQGIKWDGNFGWWLKEVGC